MKKYTKGVLTVIAICLVSIAFKDTSIVEKAFTDVKSYTMVASTKRDSCRIMGKTGNLKSVIMISNLHKQNAPNGLND